MSVRAHLHRRSGCGRSERSQRDAALAEEIDCHLDMLAAEFRASGRAGRRGAASRRDASSAASIASRSRPARRAGFPLIESLWQDVVFALRQLRRTPIVHARRDPHARHRHWRHRRHLQRARRRRVPQPLLPGSRSARDHPRGAANGSARFRPVLPTPSSGRCTRHRSRSIALVNAALHEPDRRWRPREAGDRPGVAGAAADARRDARRSAACSPTARRSPVPTRSSC